MPALLRRKSAARAEIIIYVAATGG